MSFSQRHMLVTVIASLIVGACAGVISSIWTSNALDSYAASLLGDRGFTALEPRKPSTNPGDYNDALQRVRDAQSRSLAVITTKTSASTNPDRWIGPTNSLGLGVVVSANGWILTTQEQLVAVNDPVTDIDVWVRGTRYTVSEFSRDTLTDFVLLKLAEANGLSPLGFGSSEDVRSGDMVFVMPNALSFITATVQSSEHPRQIGPQPAEIFATDWQMSVTASVSGPVVSATGDLLAFMSADAQAIPLHHAAAYVQETLRSGVVTPAALGAYVIDISDIYNLDPELRQGLNAGALVIAPVGRLAVPVNTPAAEAGVLAKDIITAVDGEAITSTTALSEILTTYDPGQTARLSVVRGGAPIEIPVVLGDATALVY
jgi:S1-C subfamily serine protease